jgi:hypothetical protein
MPPAARVAANAAHPPLDRRRTRRAPAHPPALGGQDHAAAPHEDRPGGPSADRSALRQVRELAHSRHRAHGTTVSYMEHMRQRLQVSMTRRCTPRRSALRSVGRERQPHRPVRYRVTRSPPLSSSLFRFR